jgi:hypothetical protein
LRIQVAAFSFNVLLGLCIRVASAQISAVTESEAPSESLHAESTDFDGAEEMIVSATRTPRRRESVPSFTTVLEGKDLDTSVSTFLVVAQASAGPESGWSDTRVPMLRMFVTGGGKSPS